MDRFLRRSSVLLLAGSLATAVLADDGGPLRVCADPDNLPYSNQERQGFENKIADVVARDLGESLNYYWWPNQRGMVRNTLQSDACDVLIGVPEGYDPVLWTKPYYRSSYVLAYRSDRKLGLRSLDDPALKSLRIGVHVNTPPYDALANRGHVENLALYRLFFDARDADPSVRPQRVLEDVLSGAVDVAVAWGPLVGYFAKQHPGLEFVALEDDPKLAMSFQFSMGAKKGATELKSSLEGVLDRREAEIRKILEDYGVPLLPLKPPGALAKKQLPTGSHQHDTN